MNNIFCIYPEDRTTYFLNGIQMALKEKFGSQFHCFKVKPKEDSHKRCLEEVEKLSPDDLIIFLGHGRSDSLFGAISKPASDGYTNSLIDAELGRIYFNEEKFITQKNIKVFRNKKIFCLSCNSAKGLGEMAISEGCQVFLGFGDIPTELTPENTYNIQTIAVFKGILKSIIKECLITCISQNYNFKQLHQLLKVTTCRHISIYIIEKTNFKYKHEVIECLSKFKNSIKVFGDTKLPVV